MIEILWWKNSEDKSDINDDEERKRENAGSTRVWVFYVIVAVKTKCEMTLFYIG